MSYDIKGYVSVRNNEEKRNGIFSATTLKMPYGATVQIPHMVLDAVEKNGRNSKTKSLNFFEKTS